MSYVVLAFMLSLVFLYVSQGQQKRVAVRVPADSLQRIKRIHKT